MRAKQMLHEIRSPLTGVVGMAKIVANTNVDMEQHQLLDVMISSGDLVLQRINDILDLFKVESGTIFSLLEVITLLYLFKQVWYQTLSMLDSICFIPMNSSWP